MDTDRSAHVSFRLPQTTLARLDDHARALAARHSPPARWNRTEALLDLIDAGARALGLESTPASPDQSSP